jgi:hypothetical protein
MEFVKVKIEHKIKMIHFLMNKIRQQRNNEEKGV